MIARTDDPLRQWEQCITRCLAERVPAKRFAQFAQQVSSQGVEGRQLAERLIIHLTDAGHDVLQQSYISTALDNGLVDEAQLLQALLASATGNGKNATYLTRSSSIPSVRAQVVVIRIVVISCNSRVRPSTRAQATDTLNAVSRWMIMISPASRQRNGTGKIHLSEDDDVLSLQKAVAGLFCNLVNSNNYVRSALESDYVPALDRTVSEGLQALIDCTSVALPQYADALHSIQQSFRSLRPREEQDDAHKANDAAMMGMHVGANIINASRPGRGASLVYLDSILNGLPSASSDEILRCLIGQFQGDVGGLIISLIVSASDLIAASQAQQHTKTERFLLQSFLINSVPSLMAQASTTFPGTTDQDMLIVQALDRLDTQGQDPFGEAYGPVARKDGGTGCQLAFVRTCLQLGLLSREHAHQLLASNGDTTALESPRPDKARLAESLRSTQSKQRQLIDELTASTSAVNVRAEVLVEYLHQLLDMPNASGLRVLLECLASRPQALDNIFLFSGARILEGVCRLIADWQWEKDKDQAYESYEGFSACLAFVISVKHRFTLDIDDLPEQGPDSLLSSLLTIGYHPCSLGDCSQEQSRFVGDWLKALLEGDEWGISGDLLSKHSPRLFYRSSPILYNQIFQAYDRSLLPTDKLGNAIESLQTVITLPALTTGIHVLISLGWQQSISIRTITDLLQTMTAPSSNEEHINNLHRAVLSTIRESLLAFLQDLQRRHPDNKDIKPLIDRTTSLAPSRAPRHFHTEELLHNQGGPTSLLDRFGHAFNALCAWETTGAFPNPVFRHEDLFLSIQLYGCPRVLRTLIDLLIFHRANAQPGEVDAALDVAAMLVVANEVSKRKFASNDSQDDKARAPRHTLRRALQYERNNAEILMSRDPQRAQAILMLHQLVEQRLAPPPLQDATGLQMHNANYEAEIAAAAAADRMDPDIAGSGMMQGLDQDAAMMDFGTGADSFDQGLDFADGAFFAPPDSGADASAGAGAQAQAQGQEQGMTGGLEGMDFNGSAVQAAQGEEVMQGQQFQPVDGEAQNQQQQQDMDLFASFDGSQDFFGQPGTVGGQQGLDQDQQGQAAAQQEQQGTDAMGAEAGQGTQAQSEEDFWASMGFVDG